MHLFKIPYCKLKLANHDASDTANVLSVRIVQKSDSFILHVVRYSSVLTVIPLKRQIMPALNTGNRALAASYLKSYMKKAGKFNRKSCKPLYCYIPVDRTKISRPSLYWCTLKL